MVRSAILAVVAAACLPAQTAAPAKKSALDKPTLEAYIRHLFVWGPQINVSITEPKPSPVPGLLEVKVTGSAGQARQEEVFYISQDGQRILRGSVYDIVKNPFHADLSKINTRLQPSFGTPGAPVVVAMFSDYQCSFCREEARMIRQNLVSAYPKQVRVYFKDFPLEQIHPWAKMASLAGRCVFRQDAPAFWKFHDWAFDQQDQITVQNFRDKWAEWAKSERLDPAPLLRCLDTKATEAEVARNQAEGRELGVHSTPTLFVNGRRLVGQISWPQLRGIIDFEIEYQKTARNAGEDCGCDDKLPSPLND